MPSPLVFVGGGAALTAAARAADKANGGGGPFRRLGEGRGAALRPVEALHTTRAFFGWSESTQGAFICILCLLVLPSTYAANRLTVGWEDRRLMLLCMLLTIGGVVAVLQYGARLRLPQYLLGASVLFLAAQVLEGVTMSLMSKVMPRSWSSGLFNSGFMATEMGIFGRVCGNALITLTGTWYGPGGVEDLTMVPIAALFVLSIGVVLSEWRTLGPVQVEDVLDDYY